MAPPMPGGVLRGGSPAANVVIAPVRGSTRRTRPAWPSVTYRAPSGPIVLPEPQVPVHPGAAKVTSSVTRGPRCAAATPGSTISTVATITIAVVDARLQPMTASFAGWSAAGQSRATGGRV